MKKTIFLFLSTLILLPLVAQQSKYYLITTNGNILGTGYNFIERPVNVTLLGGVAPKGDKYALLDSLGSLITPFIYDEITYGQSKKTDNGLIAAKRDGKFGNLNYKGEEFIPFIYDHQFGLNNILLFLKDKKYVAMNNKGKIILNDYVAIFRGGNFGLIEDDSGKQELITYLGKRINLPDSIKNIDQEYVNFNPGIGAFSLDYKKLLVADSLGNVLFYFPREYATVNTFDNEYSVSYIYNGDGKRALLDRSAKLLTPFDYDIVCQCNYGKGYILIKNGVYQFIDKDGKLLIEAANKIEETETQRKLLVYTDAGVQLYDYAGKPIKALREDTQNTGSWQKFKDYKTNRYGYKDKEGTIVIPADYDFINDFVYDHAIVKKKRKMGLIDRSNKLTIAIKYDYVDNIKEDNIVMIKKGDQAFFADFNGNPLGEVYNTIWQLMRVDSLRYVAYYPDREACLLDGRGQVIVPRGRYNDIDPNTRPDKVLLVSKSGYSGYIDAVSGEEVVSCEYESISKIETGYLVENEYGKYGLAKDGKEVITCKFDQIEYLNNNAMLININGLWGVVDLNGSYIIQPEYKSLTFFSNNIFIAVKE